MKTRLLHSLPLLGCLAFVSCFPIPGGPRGSRPDPSPNPTVTSTDQQKINEQRERMKERDEQKKKQELADKPKEKTNETNTEKPAEKKTGDYAFANPVPGKEGFVFSPYNNKLVDVRDIPSGTLVQDPTYPASEKKYFRVP